MDSRMSENVQTPSIVERFPYSTTNVPTRLILLNPHLWIRSCAADETSTDVGNVTDYDCDRSRTQPGGHREKNDVRERRTGALDVARISRER